MCTGQPGGAVTVADGAPRQVNQGRLPETPPREKFSDDALQYIDGAERLQRQAQDKINAGAHPNQIGSNP